MKKKNEQKMAPKSMCGGRFSFIFCFPILRRFVSASADRKEWRPCSTNQNRWNFQFPSRNPVALDYKTTNIIKVFRLKIVNKKLFGFI